MPHIHPSSVTVSSVSRGSDLQKAAPTGRDPNLGTRPGPGADANPAARARREAQTSFPKPPLLTNHFPSSSTGTTEQAATVTITQSSSGRLNVPIGL